MNDSRLQNEQQCLCCSSLSSCSGGSIVLSLFSIAIITYYSKWQLIDNEHITNLLYLLLLMLLRNYNNVQPNKHNNSVERAESYIVIWLNTLCSVWISYKTNVSIKKYYTIYIYICTLLNSLLSLVFCFLFNLITCDNNR